MAGRVLLADDQTPGRYRVQAALDGIWLSPTETLVASEEAPGELPVLDVGAPAGGVAV